MFFVAKWRVFIKIKNKIILVVSISCCLFLMVLFDVCADNKTDAGYTLFALLYMNFAVCGRCVLLCVFGWALDAGH